MKTQNTNLLSKLTSREIVDLTKDVKETVAAEYQSMNRVFSSADLWNIQRTTRRTRISRRHFA
jgi:hypothetical protein